MPQQIFMPRCINNVPYLADEINPHQALWMFTKEQIKHMQHSCDFFNQNDTNFTENRGLMVYMSSFSVIKLEN